MIPTNRNLCFPKGNHGHKRAILRPPSPPLDGCPWCQANGGARVRIRGAAVVCFCSLVEFLWPWVPGSCWCFVSRMGVWGLRVCSLDVAFTSATIRNCPQPFAWGPYGRAYGKFCKRDHFWMFPALRSYVSRGRRGTSWHSDVFRRTVSMQAQYFCVVFTRCVALVVAGATLWWPPSSLCVAGVAL